MSSMSPTNQETEAELKLAIAAPLLLNALQHEVRYLKILAAESAGLRGWAQSRIAELEAVIREAGAQP